MKNESYKIESDGVQLTLYKYREGGTKTPAGSETKPGYVLQGYYPRGVVGWQAIFDKITLLNMSDDDNCVDNILEAVKMAHKEVERLISNT